MTRTGMLPVLADFSWNTQQQWNQNNTKTSWHRKTNIHGGLTPVSWTPQIPSTDPIVALRGGAPPRIKFINPAPQEGLVSPLAGRTGPEKGNIDKIQKNKSNKSEQPAIEISSDEDDEDDDEEIVIPPRPNLGSARHTAKFPSRSLAKSEETSQNVSESIFETPKLQSPLKRKHRSIDDPEEDTEEETGEETEKDSDPTYPPSRYFASAVRANCTSARRLREEVRSQHEAQMEYEVPKELQSTRVALGEESWTCYIKLMESFVNGKIDEAELDKGERAIFQVDERLRAKIRRMMKKMVDR
jgi:hypothetical protein